MPLGGRLCVETSNASVPPGEVRERVPVKPGRYAILSVSDTGEGMPAAVQERIFEPFFTTKDTGAGTGLGLATVYGIVKQSGGYIWVDSAPGRGSRFRMYLPLHGAVVERPPAEARPAVRGGGETVLVAEDEDAVRTMVRRVLEDHGYSVLTAANGTEALDVARHHADSVDLLVSDVVMPGMSGAALAAALRELRPGLPVILMSGYAEPTASREALDTASYLQKPFSPRVLAETVRDALAAGAVASAPPIAEAI
jgi:CheY-like chemotaxis protein